MCYETGIGSGTLWPENNLFSTYEEALIKCAGKNQKLIDINKKDSK